VTLPIVDRPGIRHTGERRKPSSNTREASRGNGLFVLVAGLPQVNMHIHQTGTTSRFRASILLSEALLRENTGRENPHNSSPRSGDPAPPRGCGQDRPVFLLESKSPQTSPRRSLGHPISPRRHGGHREKFLFVPLLLSGTNKMFCPKTFACRLFAMTHYEFGRGSVFAYRHLPIGEKLPLYY